MALADSPVPEKRVIVFADTDFPGGDIQQIFDTTLRACESACLGREDCTAFTFNARNDSCFLKSGAQTPAPYDGAYSANVVPVSRAVRVGAAERIRDLGFLEAGDIAAATTRAQDLPFDYHAGGFQAADLAGYARDAEANADPGAAMRYLAAKTVLTGAGADWTDFARVANVGALSADDPDRKRDLFQTALNAAIAGFLRAQDAAIQADALAEMAKALEKSGRGRAAIAALRLAQSIAPREATAVELDRLVGMYGFRVTDTQVASDAATPSICATFSEPLVAAGVDYAPFVQSTVSGLAVSVRDSQLCVEGVRHGERYRITLRTGLPAASGEKLTKPVVLNLYVRDRSPSVHFPGRAYVLAAAPDAGLPVVVVNGDTLDLELARMPDRNLVRAFDEGLFGNAISQWDASWFNETMAEPVWSGTATVSTALNRDVTSRLPIGEAVAGQPPGVYVLRAQIAGANTDESPAATQWFVISDIGLTTMQGVDGLHVFVRSLASAEPVVGAKVELVSRANDLIATTATDARGYAAFSEGQTAGQGSAGPALVVVKNGDDLAFLSLTGPAFDLSDRGVAGHPSPPPIDMFLTTDRGAYRAGETIHATALARDGRADAIGGLPVSAILLRPDGVEYARQLSNGAGAGGHVFDFALAGNAPRGTWRLDLHADPQAPPLASTPLLVEDFLPERIDYDLALSDLAPRRDSQPVLSVDARYLFGAPGADLAVEGTLKLRPVRHLPAWPGYEFGPKDDLPDTVWETLDTTRTDAQGHAELAVDFPVIDAPGLPLEASLDLEVSEGSGRPVERSLTVPVGGNGPVIGIRPDFDGTLAENAEAGFDVIALDADGAPMAATLHWEMNRVETRYQWYSVDGNWDWEPSVTRTRVASGKVVTGDGPARIAGQTKWGEYELVVSTTQGARVVASVGFGAGWYAPADTATTPDMLEVSLDAPRYRPGDTATLRFVPRAAGKALVAVVSNRLIDMVAVDAVQGENTLPLTVTDDWGAGAYVTVTLVRPLAGATGHAPTRALGLAHAGVDPGARKLSAAFDVPHEARPRTPLDVTLHVGGVADGQIAYATIAAVDVGILNLTSFAAPDPVDHYFGQRRLGMAFRDLYGRLIDGRSGAMGSLRSGGDAMAMAQMRMQAPPPTEAPLALFSGPLKVRDGKATARFDLPAFNGTVRLMAVVWSDKGVGNASTDVLVRDPVVVTASLPRFLAPGDHSRMLLELTHATGPAGTIKITAKSEGIALGDGGFSRMVTLAEHATERMSVPIVAPRAGVQTIDVALTTPDGTTLDKTLTLPVTNLDPEIAQTTRVSLAPGQHFSLTGDVMAGLDPASARANITAGPLARLDVAGMIDRLDRYPYGCTEQQTSRALPLLYLGDLARAMGANGPDDPSARVHEAITAVLANQSSAGSFGLWQPGGGDLWLDAFVTDFLSRARAQGYPVPDTALRAANDNLQNRVNYYPDFDKGGTDLAYALYVLAREGAAAAGDLRYYADEKAQSFATPLAVAQIGAALAAYGDATRADAMFARADRQLRDARPERQIWRDDYGTGLRDVAAVLALAVEAGSTAVDRDRLVTRLARARGALSTQEATWSLLAANALLGSLPQAGVTLDGAPLDSPVVRLGPAALSVPKEFANTGTEAVDLTVNTLGVPEVPAPPQGNGYAIERRYFTLDGTPTESSEVTQGTRLVTVLTVTPWSDEGGRLMVTDPLPGGFEIDNPNLLRAGDITALDWLDVTDQTETVEFRQDRFLAAVDWTTDGPFRLAYIVRAVNPGVFHHPAASVEDMYRPRYRATGAAGTVRVTE